MRAIDTNLIVRYLTGDHPEQSARAGKLVDSDDVFVGATVLLETEWLLRSVYDYTPGILARALRAFAGLPRVTVEEPALIVQALDLMEAGLDFADALHLAMAKDCADFVTFDRPFARAANKLGAVKVTLLNDG